MGSIKSTGVVRLFFAALLVGCPTDKKPPSAGQGAAPAQPSAAKPASQPSPPSTSTLEFAPQVTKALEVVAKIEADPDQTDAILQGHELTRDTFAALMIEISRDPELAGQYELGLAAKSGE